MSVADLERDLENLERARINSRKKIQVIERNYKRSLGSNGNRDKRRLGDDRGVTKRRLVTTNTGSLKRLEVTAPRSDSEEENKDKQTEKDTPLSSSSSSSSEKKNVEEDKHDKSEPQAETQADEKKDQPIEVKKRERPAIRVRPDRSRRLFGVLLGQLNKAKKQITEEERHGPLKKQSLAESKVDVYNNNNNNNNNNTTNTLATINLHPISLLSSC